MTSEPDPSRDATAAHLTPEPHIPEPSIAELGEQARRVLSALAERPDLMAFSELLSLNEFAGQCLGQSARTLAAHGSWSQVAGVAGTTKQAAWARWRG